MSLAGLVDYGSSDESDNETSPVRENRVEGIDEEDKISDVDELINRDVNQGEKKTFVPVPIENEIDSESEEDSNSTTSNSLHLDTLPKPKTLANVEDEIEDDIPKAKVSLEKIAKPVRKEKGPLKITIPSLSEFDEDDDGNSSKKYHKFQPSKKLPGVLALLPPPKGEAISTANLVPDGVKRMPTKSSTSLVPRQVKAPPQKEEKPPGKPVLKPKIKPLDPKTSREESEDEEEASSTDDSKGLDFFSLSKPINLPVSAEEFAANILPMETQVKVVEQPKAVEQIEVLNEKKLTSTVMNLPREEIILKNKAEVGPKLPVPEQEYHVDAEGNVAFDSKAIEYLCGKRGTKRKNEIINETEIIDINGEDIRPNEREWLVKALTEESVQRPLSIGAGPGGQSKKKHQITYLAHQAKAMELELKNQWAENRLARKQTQSKYGF